MPASWRGCASRSRSCASEREKVASIANSADSLLKAEQAAQERLAQQIRQIEAENLALKADLGFFERLLPAIGEGMNVRGLQAEVETPGQLRYQLLVMQPGTCAPSFSGQLRSAAGRHARRPALDLDAARRRASACSSGSTAASKDCSTTRPRPWYKSIQVKVMDDSGGVRAHAKP